MRMPSSRSVHVGSFRWFPCVSSLFESEVTLSSLVRVVFDTFLAPGDGTKGCITASLGEFSGETEIGVGGGTSK